MEKKRKKRGSREGVTMEAKWKMEVEEGYMGRGKEKERERKKGEKLMRK